ncbi:MAG: homoserine kinase [Armatimonadota bacterium]|nr:homoserine kinase [Armatimonadota bacterium]MDR5703066.1 homoserine kinase [Armatimonadota bacterium]MDR7434243.1 homoserine kinase [Armatimonadota bacterium]
MKVEVQVPATIANLGPGFDALGLAVRLYNSLTVEIGEEFSVEIRGEGEDDLPRDRTHLAYRAIEAVMKAHGVRVPPIRLCQQNAIPIKRGLGSSASAIVAGLLAGTALAGGRLSKEDLIDLAWRMEGHPDNVTASMLGGLVVSAVEDDRVRWVKVPVDPSLRVILAIPALEVATEEARRVLPESVPFRDAVFNVGRTAMLLAALSAGRMDLLWTATADRLHQVYRLPLVPWLFDVIHAAREAGAFGAVLSGSGPTVAAFAEDRRVGLAMKEAFEARGIHCRVVETEPDFHGARVNVWQGERPEGGERWA